MQPAKPLSTLVIMGLLTAILTSACVVGNGFVVAVIARFKSLRTVPNILTANLAVVDLLNAAINIPAFMLYIVLDANWLRGKTLAIANSILNRLFTIFNLLSMLAMTVDMNLAISFDLKYLGWKTNKKALVCVALIWFISIVSVMFSSIPLFDIDLGDARVAEYRVAIFKRGKHFVASFMAFFLIIGGAVCFLTTRAVQKKKKKRAKLNLPPLQAEARLKEDIKAIKTIAMTIAAYFLCYVPSIAFAMTGTAGENLAGSWFGFIAWYCLYISSAVNPIIYYLRSSRCRSAFKQFLKNPFGSSNFKEKPNIRGNTQKRRNEVSGTKKKDGEEVENGEASEIDRDRSQTGLNCSGERRNEMIVLSLEILGAGTYFKSQEDGDGSGRDEERKAEEGSGKAPGSRLHEPSSSKGTTQKGGAKKESGERSTKWGLVKPLTGKKVLPMGVTKQPRPKGRPGFPAEGGRALDEHVDDSFAGNQNSEIQKFSRKRRNALITGQEEL